MLVHHRACQPDIAPDHHIGQHHRVFDLAADVHPHLREQHGSADRGAADHTAAGHQGIERHPATGGLVENELGRRQLALTAQDRPLVVVQIELRELTGEVDVGGPERIDRADVAPIGALADTIHAAVGKAVCPDTAFTDQLGQQVVSKIVAGGVQLGISRKLLEQELGIEHIDAHAGQRPARIAGQRGRMHGFFNKGDDAVRGVDAHHTETAGLGQGDLDAGDRHVGAPFDVLGQHDRIVHLVDMIAGQDQHVTRRGLAQDVEVLEYRIGRAAVPAFVDPLLRRDHIDVLAQIGLQESPAALDVPDQALGLVLRQHADAPGARIDAVAQREIDDRKLAGERHRRLGAPLGQLLQAGATPARQDQRIGVAHQVVHVARAARAAAMLAVFEAVRNIGGVHGYPWVTD